MNKNCNVHELSTKLLNVYTLYHGPWSLEIWVKVNRAVGSRCLKISRSKNMGRYDMSCISSYRGSIQSKKRTSKFSQPIQPTTPPNVPYNSHACSRLLRSCLAPHFLSPLRQPTSKVHKSTTASQHLVAGGSKIDCPWCPLPFCAQVLLETVLFCIGCFCSLRASPTMTKK